MAPDAPLTHWLAPPEDEAMLVNVPASVQTCSVLAFHASIPALDALHVESAPTLAPPATSSFETGVVVPTPTLPPTGLSMMGSTVPPGNWACTAAFPNTLARMTADEEASIWKAAIAPPPLLPMT